MEQVNMGDSEWRPSTRRLHGPGGSSNMSSVLGFGYNGNNNNNTNKKTEKTKEKESNNDSKEETEIENKRETMISENKEEMFLTTKSDASKVREFTCEAGSITPDRPLNAMNVNEVKFIGKMILDEMLELFSTVMESNDAKNELKTMIDNAKSIPKMKINNNNNNNNNENEEYKLIAEQADAFVDIWYYSLNAACKKGINCSKIFNIVHNANMAKRDPITKKFLKRNDGKIIKPKGWKPPNVENEIKKQIKYGAWTKQQEFESEYQDSKQMKQMKQIKESTNSGVLRNDSHDTCDQ